MPDTKRLSLPKLVWVGTLVTVLSASPVFAQAPVTDSADLGARLERIERLLDAGSLVQLLNNVKTLQQEVRALRGDLELQAHTLSQLKQRQRDLYLDVDRRLQQLEGGTIPVPGVEPATIGSNDNTTSEAAAANTTPSTTLGTTGLDTVDDSQTPLTTLPANSASTPTVATTTVEAEQPASDPVAEQQDYQAAFDLLKAGRYDQATASLHAFIKQYPAGKYGDNAQYWLGETYYVTRQFEAAMVEFTSLVSNYPASQKLTHALLKIGYIHDELGQAEDAKRVLEDLSNRYSQTTAAGLARKRLLRMRSQ